MALGGEENEDGEEQAEEGEGGDVREEDGVVPVRGGQVAEGEAREERGAEGDPEEYGYAGGDGGVGDVGCGAFVADDADE